MKKEQEIEQLVAHERYEDALDQIDELMEQAYETESLYLQKLHCLMQVDAWEAMEKLAEPLSKLKDRGYKYEYKLFYYISLYHQAQYKLVIELIEEQELPETVPEEITQAIQTIYDSSQQQIKEEAHHIEQQMQMAIISTNEQAQWQLFHQWSQLDLPPPAMFVDMLAHPDVNRFVKTFIIDALQTWEKEGEVTIVKGDHAKETTLSQLPTLTNHPIYQATYKRLAEIEHFNPTLFELSKDLFHRYMEYIYPFLYSEEEIITVSEAVFTVADFYLEGSMAEEEFDPEKLQQYINEVAKSNEAYFKLMLT